MSPVWDSHASLTRIIRPSVRCIWDDRARNFGLPAKLWTPANPTSFSSDSKDPPSGSSSCTGLEWGHGSRTVQHPSLCIRGSRERDRMGLVLSRWSLISLTHSQKETLELVSHRVERSPHAVQTPSIVTSPGKSVVYTPTQDTRNRRIWTRENGGKVPCHVHGPAVDPNV